MLGFCLQQTGILVTLLQKTKLPRAVKIFLLKSEKLLQTVLIDKK
jgi:hypothetical protein